jgi:hypothetical protein
MKKRLFSAALLGAFCMYSHAQIVSNFEDISLSPDTFLNGADGSGGWLSGRLYFMNQFDANWQSWSGFSVSSKTDSITKSWSNQYSAITATGANSSQNYAVVYNSAIVALPVAPGGDTLAGVSVTNSTYTFGTLRDGDAFSKKFGGVSGNDPDYFFVRFSGLNANGSVTGAVDFYLADFRFPNNTLDYIVPDWQWVDLSSLGKINSLSLSFFSSDTGMWGINTPVYACLDSLVYLGSGGGFAPMANIDYLDVNQKMGKTTVDVIANDVDPDSPLDSLTLHIVSQPVDATVAVVNLLLEITPGATAYGLDYFGYAVCDENGYCDTTDAFLVFNAPPMAASDTFSNTGIWQILDNDSDEAKNLLTITIIDSLTTGSITRVDSAIEITGSYGPGQADMLRYSICDEFSSCDTATAVINIPLVKGIAGSSSTEIEIYPNPFARRINITGATAESFILRDMAGRIVFKVNLPGQKISLPELPSGGYLAEVITSHKTYRLRLIH